MLNRGPYLPALSHHNTIMARVVVMFTFWHVVILACACLAVWYITKTWSPARVVKVIESVPAIQPVSRPSPIVLQDVASPPRMNVQLMPTHIPNNPAADTRFTELTPAKVIGTLVNSAAEVKMLPLYAQACPKARYKWYYFTRIGPGPDAMVVALQLKGRDCMAEFGCDELSSGDSLTVAGLGDIYTVSLYRDSY